MPSRRRAPSNRARPIRPPGRAHRQARSASDVRTASRTAATACRRASHERETQAAGVSPSTRVSHASGAASSARVGSVCGDSQTVLKPLTPTRSTTARTKAPPWRYCCIFRSRPSSRRTTRSSGEPPSRRLSKRSRIGLDAGHDARSDRVHDLIGVALEQGHEGLQPVEHHPLLRGLQQLQDARALAAAHRSGGGPQPGGKRRGVEVGHVGEGRQLALEMVAQPGHGCELQPVGLLVQADPHPEVAWRDVEPALDVGDVGRHEQQPAACRLRITVAEDLVLAEDLARQVRQQPADLHARHPPARRARQPPGLLVLELAQRGRDIDPQARRRWRRSSHCGRRRRRRCWRARRRQLRVVDDVSLGLRREHAQLRDNGVAASACQRRPGPREPAPGGGREVPVDQLGPAWAEGTSERSVGSRTPASVAAIRSRPPRPLRAPVPASRAAKISSRPFAVVTSARQRGDAVEPSGLGPTCPSAGRRVRGEAQRERSGEAGDREGGQQRTQLRVGGRPPPAGAGS